MRVIWVCRLQRPELMPTLTIEDPQKVDDYEKRVREIAVSQCRCETGADLRTDVPKDDRAPLEHRAAA